MQSFIDPRFFSPKLCKSFHTGQRLDYQLSDTWTLSNIFIVNISRFLALYIYIREREMCLWQRQKDNSGHIRETVFILASFIPSPFSSLRRLRRLIINVRLWIFSARVAAKESRQSTTDEGKVQQLLTTLQTHSTLGPWGIQTRWEEISQFRAFSVQWLFLRQLSLVASLYCQIVIAKNFLLWNVIIALETQLLFTKDKLVFHAIFTAIE